MHGCAKTVPPPKDQSSLPESSLQMIEHSAASLSPPQTIKGFVNITYISSDGTRHTRGYIRYLQDTGLRLDMLNFLSQVQASILITQKQSLMYRVSNDELRDPFASLESNDKEAVLFYLSALLRWIYPPSECLEQSHIGTFHDSIVIRCPPVNNAWVFKYYFQNGVQLPNYLDILDGEARLLLSAVFGEPWEVGKYTIPSTVTLYLPDSILILKFESGKLRADVTVTEEELIDIGYK